VQNRKHWPSEVGASDLDFSVEAVNIRYWIFYRVQSILFMNSFKKRSGKAAIWTTPKIF
jgi:hypothetical protein